MQTLLRASLFALLAVACAFGRGRASGYCQQGGQTIQVLGYVSSAATPVQASYTGTGCNVLVLYSNGGGVTATGPSGLVSTIGTAVTWLAGNVFNANGQWAGLTIAIAATPYTISTCSSATSCTLTSSAGTQTSVVYSMSASTPAAIFSDNAGTGKSNPFTVSSAGYWFYYADNGSYANQYSGTAIQSTYTNAALPLSDPSNLPNVIRWNATLGTTFAQQCTAAQAAPNTAIAIDTVAPVATGFTASCPVVFYPGGFIQPANGQTVTLTIQSAGMTKICDISPGGHCNINTSDKRVYPQWWGGVGDLSTNDTAAVSEAHNSACNTTSSHVVYTAGFGIAEVTKANPILPSCSNLTLDLQVCPALQVMANSGSYASIIGYGNSSAPAHSNFHVIGPGCIDANTQNNPIPSSGDLDAYPRIPIHTGNGGGTNNSIEDITLLNGASVWCFLIGKGSTNSRITHTRVVHFGGGMVQHDSSCLYVSNGADGFLVDGNDIESDAPASNIAATAIETHAGGGRIVNNFALNFSGTGNYVGDSAATTRGLVVANNIHLGTLVCPSLWAQNTLGTPDPALDDVDEHDNVCIVNQTVPGYVSDNYAGSGFVLNSASNLNFSNISIHDNITIFDVDNTSMDPINATANIGGGWFDASGSSSCTNCTWARETVVNSPSAAFLFQARGSNISVVDPIYINPGSSPNSALTAPYRKGVFFGSDGAVIGGIVSVKGGTISDTFATSRMTGGVGLNTINTSGIVIDGLTVSATDATATSVTSCVDANTGTQLAYMRVTCNVPSAKAAPTFAMASGSTYYSMQEGLLYTFNGSDWTAFRPHVGLPTCVASCGWGSGAVIIGTDRGGLLILGTSPDAASLTITFRTPFQAFPIFSGCNVTVAQVGSGVVPTILFSTSTTELAVGTSFMSPSSFIAGDQIAWSCPDAE